ncbi:hypothetical protein ABBQ32_009057 [Trebouxia sp. C0010 RCD-2024]
MTDSIAIVEYGSHTFRAGLAYIFPSDQEPRLVIPASVRSVPLDGTAERPVGTALLSGTDLSQPSLEQEPVVQDGNIVHWPGFEALLHYALYQQLGWQIGEEGSVIMPEPLFTSRADREQLTQLAFEEFNMTGFFLCDQPVCSLYAVDVAVVAEGQVNYHNTKRLPYGGRDLDALFVSLLQQRGIQCSDTQKLKEMCARISNASSTDTEAAPTEVHTLPDGQNITIEGEGQQLAQAILTPMMLNKDLPDLPAATVTQIMQHPDAATRKAFAENMLLCGGGSRVPGLSAKFAAEMQSVSPPSLQPAMCNCPDYMPEKTLHYSSWMGAAILSKLVFQQNQHITKLDYEEAGPTVVHKKCC